MKIVNDTEIFEPNECYFSISSDNEDSGDGMVIVITSIEFWNENECLDDCFGDHSLDQNVSQALTDAGIYNEMEATWVAADMPEDEARKALANLGFVESKEMGEQLHKTAHGL